MLDKETIKNSDRIKGRLFMKENMIVLIKDNPPDFERKNIINYSKKLGWLEVKSIKM